MSFATASRIVMCTDACGTSVFQDKLANLRKVYDTFLAEFPLCFGYWKKYADLEVRHRVEPVAEDEKTDVLRAYLKRWKAEVGVFFDGVGPDSSDEQIRAIAPRHPVFMLQKKS